MEQVIHEFEDEIVDGAGVRYKVTLRGSSRPGDTWQGWLVFERADGASLATGVETTQSNAEALRYWATGLTDAYFEGALARASSPRTVVPAPAPPLPVVSADYATRRERLAAVERAILDSFARRGAVRLLTRELFAELPNSGADVVRALEDLEKQGGLLLRRTEEGNDWVYLTADGAEAAGVTAR